MSRGEAVYDDAMRAGNAVSLGFEQLEDFPAQG
jgi:hypothetical protein